MEWSPAGPNTGWPDGIGQRKHGDGRGRAAAMLMPNSVASDDTSGSIARVGDGDR